MKSHPSGFTLVETLVTISIIAVVASLSVVGMSKAKEKARLAVEITATRNLIAGYLSHAADNNGAVLAGYKDDPTATNLFGEPLGIGVERARYPFRLAPSLSSIKGTLYFNENEAIADKKDNDYTVSLKPNMGINGNFVGGFFGGNSLLDPTSPRLVAVYGPFYLSRTSQADSPERLIVFASSRFREGSTNSTGYHEVQPPRMTGNVWSSEKFQTSGNPKDHGYVDFRWGGKAVTAMLGGNIELHTEEELRDMRYWSYLAAQENNPNYVVTRMR